MAAYRKKEDGDKLWLVESSYGGWILQYRPTRGDVRNLVGNGIFEEDVNVYSIKVKEIERKKLFSLKTKDGKFIRRAKGWEKAGLELTGNNLQHRR